MSYLVRSVREVDEGAAYDGAIGASARQQEDTAMDSKIKEAVLEVANEVYGELRGGHDESVYHQAMAYEFRGSPRFRSE